MLNQLSVLMRVALAVFGCVAAAACGSFGGTGLTTTGIPNLPAQTSFRVVGDIGTPFTGIISDIRSSWSVQGTIPFTVEVINGQPPFRMIVTKSTANTALLSLEIIVGFGPVQVVSTSQPFGTVQVQTGGSLVKFAPPAVPDARFFFRGPRLALMTGLIEDFKSSFAVEQRAPTLFLFDSPDGRVDGIFTQVSARTGPMAIDLIFTPPAQPTVVCREINSNGKITIRFPGCTATPIGSALTGSNIGRLAALFDLSVGPIGLESSN